MSSAYRDDDDILRGRIRELRKQRLQELFELPPVFFQVYQRRVGRIWAGLAGILGFLGLVLGMLYVSLWLHASPTKWNFSALLLAAALFPVVAYFISQLFVGRLLLRKLLAPYQDEGEPHFLLESLRRLSVQQAAKESISTLERRSVGLLLVALSFLAPLTIHLVVSFLFTMGINWMENFGLWIAISLIIVGHCHLLLAWLSWGYSKRISGASVEEFALMQGAGWRALGLVTLSSFIPAIFAGPLFFILMIMVGVTGLLFIPAMFGWARNVLAYERAELELALDVKSILK